MVNFNLFLVIRRGIQPPPVLELFFFLFIRARCARNDSKNNKVCILSFYRYTDYG